jgi:hypothetical protein
VEALQEGVQELQVATRLLRDLLESEQLQPEPRAVGEVLRDGPQPGLRCRVGHISISTRVSLSQIKFRGFWSITRAREWRDPRAHATSPEGCGSSPETKTRLCVIGYRWGYLLNGNGDELQVLDALVAAVAAAGGEAEAPATAVCAYWSAGGEAPADAPQVRKTPSWPRSRANFSLLSLYSRRNAWASLHLLGKPDTLLAPGTRQIEQACL